MIGKVARLLLVLLILLFLILGALRLAAHLREDLSAEDLAPKQGQFVSTDMGRVYVQSHGPETGRPVMMVHGSVGWSGFWVETAEALAANGYRAIAFDLSPMGFTDFDAAGDYSRARQSDRILALVEALGIKPVLLAHSFGAGPGTEAVMKAPNAFESYVMVAGAVGMNGHLAPKPLPAVLKPLWLREVAIAASVTNPWITEWLLARFLEKTEAATPFYGDILRFSMTREGTTPELAKWVETLLVPPLDALSTRELEYGKVSVPTTLIWGSEDTATPLAQGQKIAQLLGGAPLLVLEGLGHIPQIENPAAFQAALFNALETD